MGDSRSSPAVIRPDMSDKFIFVFLDDFSVDVVSPKENLVGGYEGTDVANGVYAFFDEQLRKMVPRFAKPNREGKFFGLLHWVVSGEYELDSGTPSKQEFLTRLGRLSLVNPNPWFKTIEEIKDYATKRS